MPGYGKETKKNGSSSIGISKTLTGKAAHSGTQTGVAEAATRAVTRHIRVSTNIRLVQRSRVV